MTTTIAVTSADFDTLVLAADRPVLVDFWASWCGPCRALAPVLDDLAEDYAGEVVVAKVDAQAEASLAAAHRVNGLPTMIVFNEGQEVERIVGVLSRTRLAAILDAHL